MTPDNWRIPYRSMDAAGSPEAAGTVAWCWIEQIAGRENDRDPDKADELQIGSSGRQGDATIIQLYRGTTLIACASLFRDEMNFTVLVRWKAEGIA